MYGKLPKIQLWFLTLPEFCIKSLIMTRILAKIKDRCYILYKTHVIFANNGDVAK